MKNNYLTGTNATIRSLLAGLFLFAALLSRAQCNPNFTYTLGANGMVGFTSTTTGTTSASYYFWTFGDGSFGNGLTATHVYTNNGVVIVCLNPIDSSTNCWSQKCDTIVITGAGTNTIAPCAPTVVYSLFKDTVQALTWTAYATYPANVTNAKWTWGDGALSTGLYPSHTYSAAGTYSTCVTVTVSCGGTITATASYCYVGNIFRSSQNNDMITVNVKKALATGIKALSNQNDEVKIYPNPNNGLFSIEFGDAAKEQGEVNIRIYNVLGEMVYEKNIPSNVKQSLDVSKLDGGTYFVKMLSGTVYSNKKITIQK